MKRDISHSIDHQAWSEMKVFYNSSYILKVPKIKLNLIKLNLIKLNLIKLNLTFVGSRKWGQHQDLGLQQVLVVWL